MFNIPCLNQSSTHVDTDCRTKLSHRFLFWVLDSLLVCLHMYSACSPVEITMSQSGWWGAQEVGHSSCPSNSSTLNPSPPPNPSPLFYSAHKHTFPVSLSSLCIQLFTTYWLMAAFCVTCLTARVCIKLEVALVGTELSNLMEISALLDLIPKSDCIHAHVEICSWAWMIFCRKLEKNSEIHLCDTEFTQKYWLNRDLQI